MGIVVFSLLGGGTVVGADLALNDGRILKNYRIKSVSADKAVVLFIADDGAPNIAEINVDLLPDNVAAALGINTPVPDAGSAPAAVRVNTPEYVVAQEAARLKTELAAIPEIYVQGRQQAAARVADTLMKKLSPFRSNAEFETLRIGADGAVVRVLRVHNSSYIKVGDLLFLQGVLNPARRFRATVYATGCMADAGNNEMLRVVTSEETSAIKFALESIFVTLGQNKPVKNEIADKASDAPVAVQPVVQPVVQQAPGQPVINNYYYYDDDNDDVVYVVRDGRRYVPMYRPGKPRPSVRPGKHPNRPSGQPSVRPGKPPQQPGERPSVRPGKHPDRPVVQPSVRPGPPPKRPNPADKLPKNRSAVQRSEKKVHSYDHLPDWAQSRFSRL